MKVAWASTIILYLFLFKQVKKEASGVFDGERGRHRFVDTRLWEVAMTTRNW